MKKKVLIIDDDSRNTFALSAVLRSRNYQCLVAGDMKNAFQLLGNNKDIKIILIDMMMPEMDGYQAIPILKADPALKNIPVVAVTAQAMTGDKEKCIAAGADSYISKPVNVDKLMEILNEY